MTKLFKIYRKSLLITQVVDDHDKQLTCSTNKVCSFSIIEEFE